MNKSDSISNLAPALVLAQANIGGAVKASQNPHFKSNFANLGDVIYACKAALTEQGIAASQFVTTLESGAPGLETILVHATGEWISSVMPVVCAKQNDPQALGSAITYARRYALQSALLIPAVDDDGEAAMFRQEEDTPVPVPPLAKPAPKVATPKKLVEVPPADCRETRIHFGNNRGTMLSELTPQQIHWYENDWITKKETQTAPVSQEDRNLINALKKFKELRASQSAPQPAGASSKSTDGPDYEF